MQTEIMIAETDPALLICGETDTCIRPVEGCVVLSVNVKMQIHFFRSFAYPIFSKLHKMN
jgi:hypothetical protein